MFHEIEAHAEQFCEECFESVLACGWDITVAEFIVKVADMMKLQASRWNVEEEE